MIAFKSSKSGYGIKMNSRFIAIIAAVMTSIIGMCVLGWFGLDIMSSLRGYAGGESLYSKGCNGAAFNLMQYAHTHEPEYYHKFLKYLKRPLGDNKAREALEKRNPDMEAAYAGFKEGGNTLEDIDGLINLFYRFRSSSHLKEAIGIWQRGDAAVADLRELGKELHRYISAGETSGHKIEKLKIRLIELNHELLSLGEEFSYSIGKASRWAKNLFIKVLFSFAAISLLISFIALYFVNKLVAGMQDYGRKLQTQNWLKSGQANLNEKMRDEADIVNLSNNIISFVCKYLGAGIGAIYVSRKDGSLKLMAGYAFEKRKELRNHFYAGEGIVGQAALEKKHIAISDCPADYIRINSGLGMAPPRNILAYPLLNNDMIYGVIELGSFKDFSEHDLEFLHITAEAIATTITPIQARNKEAELLEKTQMQTEELTAQQEELRVTNEELESHTRNLIESEQKLQEQQEELRVTNEELTEQTQILKNQKEEIAEKNRALETAKKAALEKASNLELTGRYKSEFLANMSHELRTPLNSMLILSKLLQENKEKNLTEKQVEFAQTINASSTDLLNLINDILDLSKIEAGKMEINISEYTLEQFVDKMQKTCEKLIDDKGLAFYINVADNTPHSIHTDAQRLEQIVKNFISNAVKFTKMGSVTLSIERPSADTVFLEDGLKPESALAFSVIDTGIGIDKDMQHFVFEAFQQVDGSTNRKYGGTGLGLSISRELAKNLGGEIQLKSEIGKGSIFTLYLPERCESGEKIPSGKPDKKKTDQALPETSVQEIISPTVIDNIRDDRRSINSEDCSILIIEDDPAFSETLKDIAREKGFKTLLAGDGEIGLHLADYYKPSAVILDVGLPGIDGWKVMSRLKESPATRHIPVHFISAADQARDAMKMGAIGYLNKPVTLEQLNQTFIRIKELINTPVRKLLIVESSEHEARMIKDLLDGDDISIKTVSRGDKALSCLTRGGYHCIILGSDLPDMNETELLDKIRRDKSSSKIPVIVYTGKELSAEDRIYLDRNSERLITKEPRSLERLFDETTLFLHRVKKNLPAEKQRILQMTHDKASILKNKTILIVDDDMRNVFALTNLLEDKEIKIVVAKNGRQSLVKLVENSQIDLILMDIMMPEMNGYEAIKRIRKMDDFKKIPIIALTAKAMRGDRIKCIEAGASDYLSKPVDSEKLLSMLRVWLYQ